MFTAKEVEAVAVAEVEVEAGVVGEVGEVGEEEKVNRVHKGVEINMRII
jgi:hypothetical protein